MCRLLGWVARQPVSLADALGRAELERFVALSRRHADGWGLARRSQPGADGPPLVQRSTTCAAKDPAFARLTTTAAADAGFVHLRWATPGHAVLPANTHPFVHEDMAFAHNGAIHPFDRLDDILPEGWSAQMTGSTDSERYFLAVAERLQAGDSMGDAVGGVVRRIFRDFNPTSLNAMLLTNEALYVVSAHDPTRAPSLCETSGGDDPSTATDLAFYDLRYRAGADAVIVASSGFDQPDGAWQPLDNMTLLRVERATLTTSTVPLAA